MPRLYPSMFERTMTKLFIVVTLLLIGVVIGIKVKPRPSPVPVAVEVKPDTVWLGCTWVETHDGKVIVKYERLVNPVLWDSMQPVKVRKTKGVKR